MTTRFPLYAKIIAWFFLNLAVLAGAGWLLLHEQFRFSAMPARVAGDHVEQAANAMLDEALKVSPGDWDPIFSKYGAMHGVEFRIYNGMGRHLAGPRSPLPAEVHSKLFGLPRDGPGPRGDGPGPPGPRGPRRPGPPDGPFDGPPRRPSLGESPQGGGPGDDFPRSPGISLAELPGKMMIQSSNPERYWVTVRTTRTHADFVRGAVVLAMSDSPTGHGFFFDTTPYVWGGIGVLVLSMIVWAPFVRGLTRSISRLRSTTAQLAEGRFDARVDERRSDEVGALGGEINRMAGRLAGYVEGQKRFLGDVAHELSAPIARLQMAIAILEQRATPDDRERLGDVREEVEHMAGLVNELLQFSRATLGGNKVELVDVNVREVAERAVRRESGDTSQVLIEVGDDIRARAEPELLARAIGNLVRNAIRYAGHAGPIMVSALRDGRQVFISVVDQGPGIPAEALPKIFDPFFRLDDARTHGTGGAGLGLSIVKTCIEACGGSVSAHNLQPSGLEVTLRLAAE